MSYQRLEKELNRALAEMVKEADYHEHFEPFEGAYLFTHGIEYAMDELKDVMKIVSELASEEKAEYIKNRSIEVAKNQLNLL